MVAIPQSGLLAQVSSFRLPSGHSGQVLTLSNAACTFLLSPCLIMEDAGVCAASRWGSYCWAHNLWVLIIICFFSPSYVAVCCSKARHRLSSESVSWCLEISLFLKIPFLGQSSVPTSFVSLFVFYIFSYLPSKTMGCFSGCLMSSAGIQKLFCGIYSAFKYSFDEFVEEKVISPSYSSAILELPPQVPILTNNTFLKM